MHILDRALDVWLEIADAGRSALLCWVREEFEICRRHPLLRQVISSNIVNAGIQGISYEDVEYYSLSLTDMQILQVLWTFSDAYFIKRKSQPEEADEYFREISDWDDGLNHRSVFDREYSQFKRAHVKHVIARDRRYDVLVSQCLFRIKHPFSEIIPQYSDLQIHHYLGDVDCYLDSLNYLARYMQNNCGVEKEMFDPDVCIRDIDCGDVSTEAVSTLSLLRMIFLRASEEGKIVITTAQKNTIRI